MNADAQPLLLELADTVANTRELSLSVAGFDVRGQVSLQGAHLHLAGRDGTVTADRLTIKEVSIMGHGLRAAGQQLEATSATVSWSDTGLQLRAASIALQALQVLGEDEPLDGTVVLDGITAANIVVDNNDVQVARLAITTLRVDAAVPAREDGSPGEESTPGERTASASSSPILERVLAVLDRLSGHVNVDLGLDLTVPVIGRRRATHHFRIPIDAGTIDYRKLEDNLSTLEDSLLDFSVRDEGLVLEVGIPFLPTRGKGKPIVVWTLDGADLSLAQQQRVRLSVLARPNMNGKDEPAPNDGGGDKSSPVSLRKAEVRGLDVHLAVAPADDSPLRRVGALVLSGDMTYATDESPGGVLQGRAENVELGAIAAGPISVAGVRLDAAYDVEVGLRGATPVRARLVAQGLQLDGLHVAPASADAGDEARTPGAGGEHRHVTHAKRV